MASTLRRSLVLFAGLGSLATPLTAFAQATDPPATPPPTTPTTPAPTDPATPPAATPAAPAGPAAEPPPNEGGHFRWGLSPMFGTFFPGPTTIAVGFEGRVGYAFNQTVTVFGSLGAVGGVGFGAEADAKSGSASVSAVSYWYLGANADALLVGPLFVGGGAGIGRGGWGVVSANAGPSGAGQEVTTAGGLMPSLDGRIGIATGSWNKVTGKRSGFLLAFDVRMLIAPDASSTRQEVNSSGAQQTVVDSKTAIGFSPMLHLGFESR